MGTSAAPPACSPTFQAHLERFRCSPSPTSTRRPSRLAETDTTTASAPSAVVLDSSAADQSPARPTRSPLKRPRTRVLSTPPRADGTSAHFQPGPEATDDLKPSVIDDLPVTPSKKKKKRPPRPYADPSEYAHLGADPLQDYLDDGLSVLLCGINPGVKSAQLGLHYANPTNHYWRCLAESGMTPRRLHPSEGPTLPSLGIGSTNLVERPTAEMSEISNQEMAARVPGLLRKVVRHKPKILAFVGMKICEVVLRYLHNLPRRSASSTSSTSTSPGRRKAMPKVKIGVQPVVISLGDDGLEAPGKIYLWCLPSTSARVVEYQLVDKVKIWTRLKADMDRLAQDPSADLDLPEGTVAHPVEALFPAQQSGTAGSRAYTVTLVKEEDLREGESMTRRGEEARPAMEIKKE
ncbi:uncharacterized protein RHOBADRAFT_56233 [Rhodotorula graminis WP1]|uniref:Uracil-DNA glycosylase-like domain-containing protein n=1 Tax=Rhodotorula graminis (strain WP1) TaxID=578459 RepID=A0A0P9EXG0_RHOGW|nr:uncharacterized protein RHOBADRAFT_56233 [Rhodotorula graminis WP1]KPV71841.1 hypothetical protein RHOBADRAFT_56233 [Rhodotorula graminis WP1]